MNATINTYGTVLRSLTRTRAGDRTESASWGLRYAAHAGEHVLIALNPEDAELAVLLGAVVVAIEEDPLPPTPPTTKERYAAAVKAIRKSGVAIRQNVSACCSGCAEPFKTTKGFDAETTPYAWNFGGQGGALKWAENGREANLPSDYFYAHPNDVTVYFNHRKRPAALIVPALTADGVVAPWCGHKPPPPHVS